MATPTQQDSYIKSRINKIDGLISSLMLAITDDLNYDKSYKGATRESAYKTFLKNAFKTTKELRSLLDRGIN